MHFIGVRRISVRLEFVANGEKFRDCNFSQGRNGAVSVESKFNGVAPSQSAIATVPGCLVVFMVSIVSRRRQDALHSLGIVRRILQMRQL